MVQVVLAKFEILFEEKKPKHLKAYFTPSVNMLIDLKFSLKCFYHNTFSSCYFINKLIK